MSRNSSGGGESAKRSKTSVDEELSFEQAMKRAEELVRRLEQGNVPLDQSLAEYSEAVELLRTCQERLDEAQVKIEVLSGFDAEGQPVVRPVADQSGMTLEEKRQARSNRRSAAEAPAARPKRKSAEVDDPGQLF